MAVQKIIGIPILYFISSSKQKVLSNWIQLSCIPIRLLFYLFNFVASDLMRTVIAVAAMLLVRACISCMTVTHHMPGIPSPPGRLHPSPLPGVCPRPPWARGVGPGRGGHHEAGAEAAQAESGGWPLRKVAFITRTRILSHFKIQGLRKSVQKLTLIQQILPYKISWISGSLVKTNDFRSLSFCDGKFWYPETKTALESSE